MDEQNFQDNQNHYQDYSQQFKEQPVVPQNESEPNKVLEIVSLVLGIIAIVSSCCGCGLLFGVGGIICAAFGKNEKKTGMLTAGLICSIVGVVLSIIAIVIIVIFSALVSY